MVFLLLRIPLQKMLNLLYGSRILISMWIILVVLCAKHWQNQKFSAKENLPKFLFFMLTNPKSASVTCMFWFLEAKSSQLLCIPVPYSNADDVWHRTDTEMTQTFPMSLLFATFWPKMHLNIASTYFIALSSP